MERWVCPACGREFGRNLQSHSCVPGGSIDDSFRRHPASHRAIYDAIAAHLDSLGTYHVDAVTVGVFLKRGQKFAEVRPMVRAVNLWLALPRVLDEARLVRASRAPAERQWYRTRIDAVSNVDEKLRDWLTEAFHSAE